MIPSLEAQHIINIFTSPYFDKKTLLQRLISGDLVKFGNILELDSSLDEGKIYLFIYGLCYGTIYDISEEGMNNALEDALEIIKTENL